MQREREHQQASRIRLQLTRGYRKHSNKLHPAQQLTLVIGNSSSEQDCLKILISSNEATLSKN